jgi:chromate transport protein ChrA
MEQIASGAGAGAWVTLAAGIANLIIFILALRYGERSINRFDWACIALVAAMLLLWTQYHNPNITILFAVTIFITGLLPTIRKASRQPNEETATEYAMAGLKFFLALFALQSFTFATAFYPLSLAVINTAFWVYLLVARVRFKPVKKRQA